MRKVNLFSITDGIKKFETEATRWEEILELLEDEVSSSQTIFEATTRLNAFVGEIPEFFVNKYGATTDINLIVEPIKKIKWGSKEWLERINEPYLKNLSHKELKEIVKCFRDECPQTFIVGMNGVNYTQMNAEKLINLILKNRDNLKPDEKCNTYKAYDYENDNDEDDEENEEKPINFILKDVANPKIAEIEESDNKTDNVTETKDSTHTVFEKILMIHELKEFTIEKFKQLAALI